MANDIDFDRPLSLEDVEKQEVLGTDKSSWVKTLTTLYEGVRTGRGEYEKFYRVGTFKNASGARTAIKNILDNFADRLPGHGFDLRPVVKPAVDVGGKRTSELWAAVAAPPEGEDDEPADEELFDETAEDQDTVEEPTKPAARKRR